jgi:hypothetical protein
LGAIDLAIDVTNRKVPLRSLQGIVDVPEISRIGGIVCRGRLFNPGIQHS